MSIANVLKAANVVVPGGVVFSANSGMLWHDKKKLWRETDASRETTWNTINRHSYFGVFCVQGYFIIML
jgi:hypothetical protein